jgi:sugar lactone lactonase YvrE
VHGIALSAAGDRLSVVHSRSASVADIDADRQVIRRVGSFAEPGQDGQPGVLITPSGGLAVNVDGKVIVTSPRREIATPGGARGLALGADNDIWAGHPNGLVHYDLATGEEIGRISIPDLYVLKHVRTGTG